MNLKLIDFFIIVVVVVNLFLVYNLLSGTDNDEQDLTLKERIELAVSEVFYSGMNFEKIFIIGSLILLFIWLYKTLR